MKFEVALTGDADRTATDHLLQHFNSGKLQEDICFAIWRPSTGRDRQTALIDEIILPRRGDRQLHRNASFESAFATRAVRRACDAGAGLAIMHSHLRPGWQNLSRPDRAAERDVLARPAKATGLPLLGMTVGSDGFWSARVWLGKRPVPDIRWCAKVRVVGDKTYAIYFNDRLVPPHPRREVLRRTFDTWGTEVQNKLARMRIGIVGLGSVGCIIAETMARIGIGTLTLIDPDRVESHNLDRLIYGTEDNVGEEKVALAKLNVQRHATASKPVIDAIPLSVHETRAYRAAIDCDLIFSCVDRPVARDILNFVANAHLVPVIDCGVAVYRDSNRDTLSAAHWRSHIITPNHQCLRCNRQYSTGMVSAELDGSLDDPSYLQTPTVPGPAGNQNVFPFSLGAASAAVNLMVRYVAGPDWWPSVGQQDYQLATGRTRVINDQCIIHCAMRPRRARGDGQQPSYLGHQIPKHR